MVNEEKIRIMAGIALEEAKYSGAEEMHTIGFYRPDYIRFHVTSALWSITVSFFLILVLIGMYHAEYLLLHIAELPYALIAAIIAGIYLLCIIIFGVGAYLYYSRKYIRDKKALESYVAKLDLLEQFYQESREKEETSDDAVTGA